MANLPENATAKVRFFKTIKLLVFLLKNKLIFRKKNDLLFKITEGRKFALECVSICFIQNCHFRPIYEALSTKESEKLER